MRIERRQSENRGDMSRKKRMFRTDRGREMTVDFMTGIGLFCLVALFAGVHEAPALPQPLAKTEAAIAETRQEAAIDAAINGVQMASLDASRHAAYASAPHAQTASTADDETGDGRMIVVMALVFSTLSALTFQFWRHLRREYASPRRKWARNLRHDMRG